MKQILTNCLAVLLLQCAVASAADAPAAQPLNEADAFAVQLISGLRSAYAGIEEARGGDDAQALHIQFDLAIQELTGLAELYQFDWAKQRRSELYLDPDCPDLHMGYSPDRRVMLRLEPMELLNPAFADYTFFLCTLESLNDSDIVADEAVPMRIELRDGSVLDAELIEPGHPLWERLGGQADSMQAPKLLPSGRNLVFKQVYAVAALGRDDVSAVSLDWDHHHFRLIWFENEVAFD